MLLGDFVEKTGYELKRRCTSGKDGVRVAFGFEWHDCFSHWCECLSRGTVKKSGYDLKRRGTSSLRVRVGTTVRLARVLKLLPIEVILL